MSCQIEKGLIVTQLESCHKRMNEIDKETSVPHISKELLEYLEERFPRVIPKMTWTEKETGAYIGEQTVVAHLRSLFEDQEANILNQRILL